jgi:uncharacterized protein (TIGR02646 family)
VRRLCRLKLSEETLAFLASRTAEVNRAPTVEEKRAEAARLWSLQRNSAFDEIRTKLHRMAPTPEHCMYCEHNEGTDIEHFWPKSSYPGRAFEWLNYLLACARCNSNFKRAQFPLDEATGQPLLIDPTVDDPRDHIALDPVTGSYGALTPKGEASIRIFGLNRAGLTTARKRAWAAIQAYIITHAATAAGEGVAGELLDMRATLSLDPHAGVLSDLVHIAASMMAEEMIDPRCLAALRRYPEIGHWLEPEAEGPADDELSREGA